MSGSRGSPGRATPCSRWASSSWALGSRKGYGGTCSRRWPGISASRPGERAEGLRGEPVSVEPGGQCQVQCPDTHPGPPAQEGGRPLRTSCIQGMAHSGTYDSVVVGAGPNGLAAAIALARSGLSVCVVEEAKSPGGCVRSDGGTLPGYVHDTCSAVFPLAVDTPSSRPFPETVPPSTGSFPRRPWHIPLTTGRV